MIGYSLKTVAKTVAKINHWFAMYYCCFGYSLKNLPLTYYPSALYFSLYPPYTLPIKYSIPYNFIYQII